MPNRHMTADRIRDAVLKRCRRFWHATLLHITNHVISRCLSSRCRLFWYRHVMKFNIAVGAAILIGCRFSKQGNLTVGEHTVINNDCRIDNREPVRIGANVSLSYGTLVVTGGHDIDSSRFAYKGEGVEIEDYVWVCARAIIQPGVKLGRGSVVLPGSVVTASVPERHVVGGAPARFVKERKAELVYCQDWDSVVPPLG